jgi:alpha-tubulin suppressor-like RCC1 family protein
MWRVENVTHDVPLPPQELAWGYGFATGHGRVTVLLPRLLEDLSSKGVVSVSANRSHTVCVTKDGELFTWGAGEWRVWKVRTSDMIYKLRSSLFARRHHGHDDFFSSNERTKIHEWHTERTKIHEWHTI